MIITELANNKYQIPNNKQSSPKLSPMQDPIPNLPSTRDLAEIRSLSPLQTLQPVYSVEQKNWCKTFKIEMMVPYANYSLKITYIFTLVTHRVFLTVEVLLIPMVGTIPLQLGNGQMPLGYHLPMLTLPKELAGITKPIRIGYHSFNCIFCVRCSLGFSCRNHSQKQKETKSIQLVK